MRVNNFSNYTKMYETKLQECEFFREQNITADDIINPLEGLVTQEFLDFYLNEGIVDWVKEKFSKIGEYFNKLKGEALVSIAASIIPKELLNYIRLQAGVSVSESLMILEEIKHMGMGLGSNDDILSPEELDTLSDEEYNDYLQNKIKSYMNFWFLKE